MHEMTIALNIVRIIEQAAQTQHFHSVSKVYVEVGPLSSVDIEALKFSFSAAVQSSHLAGTQLVLIELAGLARCESCLEEVPIKHFYDACPCCGSYQLTVLQGDELRVKNLEVE